MTTQQQTLYTHAAAPKAVQQRKAKYREDEPGPVPPANIMFDRRVVRGNTYAARIMPAEPPAPVPRKTLTQKRKSLSSSQSAPPRTPEAVYGRKHMDIQTDVYLEELTDTVPEVDNTTQTDAFLDRPPTPLFVPQKTGTDAVTQIEQGDLFDFDLEVEPILEVLAGKVLEQGLMEVLEEEELAAMKAHQEHFEQIRNAELAATQRMEAAERRKREEKERRLAQERERLERERVVRRKVAASTFARGYLNGIVHSVFDSLTDSGFFYDPRERTVKAEFMPWLRDQATRYLSQGIIARQVVKRLVADAAQLIASQRAAASARAAAQTSAASTSAAAEVELAAAASAHEQEVISTRATYILTGLSEPVVTLQQVAELRSELTSAAEAEAEAAYEEAKAAAAEAAREKAENELAEWQAKMEEEAAAREAEREAAAAARGEDEEGEEAEAAGEPEAEPQPPVDVEKAVQEAMDAVVKPKTKEVTDADVLSAFLDRGIVTREQITDAIVMDELGDDAWSRHHIFTNPPVIHEPAKAAPTAKPPSGKGKAPVPGRK